MFEAILPLRLSGEWQDFDLERSKILMRSLSRFWGGDKPLRLNIIASRTDLQEIKAKLGSEVLDINLLDETEVLQCLPNLPDVPGWYKQQVLKLAAHRFISAKFYLVLDADVICTRRFSELDLVVGGKALTDWETKDRHPNWWRASARLLQMDEQPGIPGMSVTPEILSKDICRDLEIYLGGIYDRDPWELLLQNRNWTEYSLYSTFASSKDMIDNFHHSLAWMTQNEAAIRSEHCVWGLSSVESWNPAGAFAQNAKGYFLVFQSNTGVNPSIILERLRGLI